MVGLVLPEQSLLDRPDAEGEVTKPVADSDPARETRWIGRREIEAIEGALEPSAYVARAYKEALKHDGHPPCWARKDETGQWLFDFGHIEADARTNIGTIGIDEAARILGATRRAVQTWVDHGTIAAVAGTDRTKGARRRILRAQFMRDLPHLRTRLVTPAVLGFKKHRSGQQATEAPASALQGNTLTGSSLGPSSVDTHHKVPGSDSGAPYKRQDKPATSDAQSPLAAGPPDGNTGGPAAVATGNEPDNQKLVKKRAANALEARLREARDAKHREAMVEAQAVKIVEKLLSDVFGGELSRVDAIVMFNDIATDLGVPAVIRTKIRKQYLGR